MDNLKEKVKENVKLIHLVEHLGIDHNYKFCRCINPAAHSNNDNHFSLAIKYETYFICFACGIKGDVIQFYMQYANADFKTALKYLSETFKINSAEIYSPERIQIIKNNGNFSEAGKDIVLPKFTEYEQEIFDERSGKYEFDGCMDKNDAMTRAFNEMKSERQEMKIRIFEDLFEFSMNHFSGIDSEILDYFLEVRKIEEEVIYSARIFSLPEVQITLDYLTSRYSDTELLNAGLFNEYKNLVFQKNHRLIIPYLSDNKIVYLRSRIFNKENKLPEKFRYLCLKNDNFHLNTSRRFYNSDILDKTNSKEEIYITEGEFDCLSMLSMGFKAIGIPGVNSMPNQIFFEKLLRFNITLCFDNDKAGKELTEKLQTLFKDSYGKKVSMIKFPDGIKDVSDFMVDHITNNNLKTKKYYNDTNK